MAVQKIIRCSVRPPLEFIGESNDTKPDTDLDGLSVPVGSKFTELDTGDEYMFDGSNWRNLTTPGD